MYCVIMFYLLVFLGFFLLIMYIHTILVVWRASFSFPLFLFATGLVYLSGYFVCFTPVTLFIWWTFCTMYFKPCCYGYTSSIFLGIWIVFCSLLFVRTLLRPDDFFLALYFESLFMLFLVVLSYTAKMVFLVVVLVCKDFVMAWRFLFSFVIRITLYVFHFYYSDVLWWLQLFRSCI